MNAFIVVDVWFEKWGVLQSYDVFEPIARQKNFDSVFEWLSHINSTLKKKNGKMFIWQQNTNRQICGFRFKLPIFRFESTQTVAA